MELSDGTIVPSFLGVRSSGYARNSGVLDNISLRLGEVKDIIYPNDPRSTSGTFVEYNVLVQMQDGSAPGTSMMFNNVGVASLFGGTADRSFYTLRPAQVDQDTKALLGDGSKVLLMCINGATRNALILSGIRNPAGQGQIGEPDDSVDDGHHHFWEFNGVQVTVDKDGQYQLLFKGATRADGNLGDGVSANASGSTVLMAKDGSIVLTSPDSKQSIKINHTDHTVDLVSDHNTNMTAGGNVVVKSAGVLVGAATDFWLLASTYRQAETQLHTQIIAQLTTIASQLAVAGISLSSGGLALATPMIGTVLAAPLLTTAGTSVTALVPAILQIITDISEFEAGAATYLSQLNRND